MNNYLIVDAVSYLDADLLAEHLERKEKLRIKAKNKKKVTLMRWSAIAACICLFVVISIIPRLAQHSVENESRVTILGGTVESSWGTITYIENNSDLSQITFNMIKETDNPFYVEFRGYNVLSEWVDEDGTPHKEMEHYAIITPYEKYNEKESFVSVDDKLIIYVNGEQVDALPIKPGQYEITIDYSAANDFLDYVDTSVYVYNYGYFLLLDSKMGD